MNLTRIVLSGIVCVLTAAAQGGAEANLAGLSQTAQQTESAWLALARDMDARVARMLPCDARATAAIDEARTASEVRLVALSAYLQEAVAEAGRETEEARGVLATSRESLNGVTVERTDIEQERAGLESQILNLTESVNQRAALGGALDQLKQIQTMVQSRAGKAAQEAASGDQVLTLLGDLVTAFEAREGALRKESAALASERVRWTAYYDDRMARARLECSITGGGR